MARTIPGQGREPGNEAGAARHQNGVPPGGRRPRSASVAGRQRNPNATQAAATSGRKTSGKVPVRDTASAPTGTEPVGRRGVEAAGTGRSAFRCRPARKGERKGDPGPGDAPGLSKVPGARNEKTWPGSDGRFRIRSSGGSSGPAPGSPAALGARRGFYAAAGSVGFRGLLIVR